MNVLENYKKSIEDLTTTSLAVWAKFASIGSGELPTDPIDGMQVQLCRWQLQNFGDVSPVAKIDCHMSLGVIEEFCEAIDAVTLGGSKGKLDGLGDICIYAGQLLNANRMALRPIIMLADEMSADWDGNPEQPSHELIIGTFARTVLKRDQRIRGFDKPEVWRPALAGTIAALIALVKVDILCCEVPDSPEEPDDDANLITNTYLKVGGETVLKRNWNANRATGIAD